MTPILHCPACAGRPLRPVRVDPILAAWGCNGCGGNLTDLLSFRVWLESRQGSPVRRVPDDEPSAGGRPLVACPRCRSVMSRYRSHPSSTRHFDVCRHCAQLWTEGFDVGGLEQVDWARVMPGVFAENWDWAVRRVTAERTVEEWFRAKLCEADYLAAREFREWLAGHPRRFEISDYLMRAVRGSQ